MKNVTTLLLGAVLSITTLSTVNAEARQAAGQQAPAQAKAVRTVIIAVDNIDGQIFVTKPSNSGGMLVVEDPQSLSEEKLTKLMNAPANRAPITLMVKGNVIVDIL